MIWRPSTSKGLMESPVVECIGAQWLKGEKIITYSYSNCCSSRCVVHLYIPQSFHLSRYLGHDIQWCKGKEREVAATPFFCPCLRAWGEMGCMCHLVLLLAKVSDLSALGAHTPLVHNTSQRTIVTVQVSNSFLKVLLWNFRQKLLHF